MPCDVPQITQRSTFDPTGSPPKWSQTSLLDTANGSVSFINEHVPR
jgi:hypothetical protein